MKAATRFRKEAERENIISIHAAREGGDQAMGWAVLHLILFQSTPPVKAATSADKAIYVRENDFNPRRP